MGRNFHALVNSRIAWNHVNVEQSRIDEELVEFFFKIVVALPDFHYLKIYFFQDPREFFPDKVKGREFYNQNVKTVMYFSKIFTKIFKKEYNNAPEKLLADLYLVAINALKITDES